MMSFTNDPYSEDYEEEYDESTNTNVSKEESAKEDDVWNDFSDNEDVSKSFFACEDCDYRWEDYYEDSEVKEENEDRVYTCPMCGSISVSPL